VLLVGGQWRPVGAQATVGGANAAWVDPGQPRRVVVMNRASGAVVRELPVGDDASDVAVSDTHAVVLTATGIVAFTLADGSARTIATGTSGSLGRPALDGTRVVFHQATRRRSRIVQYDLATNRRTILRTATRRQLTNPSLLGEQLLYVETTPYQQALVLGSAARGRGRTLVKIAPAIRADKGYSTAHGPHRPGIKRPRRPAREGPPGSTTTLWTTALAADAAYVTRLREKGTTTRAALLRVGL
jgi:hypothetical protein